MLNLEVILDPDREPDAIKTAAQTEEPEGSRWGIAGPDDLPGDWRVEFEERASIREYDGGQAREHAEAQALREIVERMRSAGEYP